MLLLPSTATAWMSVGIGGGGGYGPNLFTDYSVEGVPDLWENGTNTLANNAGVLSNAYVDAAAPRLYMTTASGNLTSAMTEGVMYLLEMEVYVDATDSIVVGVDAGTSPSPASYTVDWTSGQKISFVFTCENALDTYWNMTDFFAGETLYFTNMSLRRIY